MRHLKTFESYNPINEEVLGLGKFFKGLADSAKKKLKNKLENLYNTNSAFKKNIDSLAAKLKDASAEKEAMELANPEVLKNKMGNKEVEKLDNEVKQAQMKAESMTFESLILEEYELNIKSIFAKVLKVLGGLGVTAGIATAVIGACTAALADSAVAITVLGLTANAAFAGGAVVAFAFLVSIVIGLALEYKKA